MNVPLAKALGLQFVTVLVVIATEQQDGQHLTSSERRLIQYLDAHLGRYIAEWELRDYLYEGGVCSDAAIRLTIHRIRRKLGQAFIERGDLGGYRLTSHRSAELMRVCAICSRPVVRYQDGFVCYGCVGTANVDLDVGRRTAVGEHSGRPWTEDEEQFISDHRDDMTNEAMGHELQRSESAVRGHLTAMGLDKQYVLSKKRTR
jgi:hypothetical protein